jgi:hypothetical protein
LVEALRRLKDARALGVHDLDLSGLPASRLKLLARYASSARAQAIQRMPAERGIATLVAFACALQASAQDDVLDVLDRLLSDLLARVDAQEKRRRFRTIGDLDRAALLLRDICLLVLDHTKPDHLLRGEIFKRVPRERIEQAIATVGELARAPENDLAPEALLSRYSMVRQFLPLLLETITPQATHGGRAVLTAWEFLRRMERAVTPAMHEAPLRVVAPAWRRLVLRPDGTVDRRAYTFCVLQAMHSAFKRRDLYVTPSQRWGDPRAQLLTAQAWQAQRTPVCRMLGLSEQPAPQLQRLALERLRLVAITRTLGAARGLCNVHAYQWLEEAHNSLGTALIYRDVLESTLRELDSLSAAPRSRRGVLGSLRKWPDALKAGSCPVCRAQRGAEGRYIEALLESLADRGAADAFDSPGLRRVRTLAAYRHGGRSAQRVVARTHCAVEQLLDELAEVFRKEDYRFRQEERSENERRAPARAIGWPPDGRDWSPTVPSGARLSTEMSRHRRAPARVPWRSWPVRLAVWTAPRHDCSPLVHLSVHLSRRKQADIPARSACQDAH